MKYGLIPNVIEQINSVFAKYHQITKVILYGSRAKGNFKNGSDIDLCLFGDRIDLSLLYKIELEMDDLLLPYTLDLSIYNNINNQELKDHIDRVGILFYEPK